MDWSKDSTETTGPDRQPRSGRRASGTRRTTTATAARTATSRTRTGRWRANGAPHGPSASSAGVAVGSAPDHIVDLVAAEMTSEHIVDLHAVDEATDPSVDPFLDLDDIDDVEEFADLDVSRGSPPLRRILVLVDQLVVAVGWLVAFSVGFVWGDVGFGPLTALAQTVLVVGAAGVLMSASGLYRRRICAVRSAEVARIARVSFGLAVVTVVVLATVGRTEALLAGVVGGGVWFVLLTLERGVMREWIHGRRASGDFGAPVVVVGGASGSTVDTARLLAEHPVLGFEVRGVLCPPNAAAKDAVFPWLGRPDDLLEQLARSGASGVVLDAGSLTGYELNAFVQRLAGTGLHVHISSGLRGIDSRRVTVSPLADETFLHVAPIGLTRRQVVTKRVLDVVVASAALVLLAPVLAVSALVVWAYDRGPVLFRQERVGQHGERFTLYKMRTMVVDAEARKAELEGENGRAGPLFKLVHDPRVTPFGRFLRASSIDEIPQLFNVLEGTMSVVGPRPALPDEVAQFDDALNERLTVKPGVTGLWQVEARDLPSFDLYRRYDLLYVQNWSVGVDVAVIARTTAVVGLRALRSLLPARLRRTAPALE
jgi:exopolysaccharide biosynthesis polyprenyl glycosylphosphotransferase